MSRLQLHELPPAAIDWQRLDALPDRNVFQTREWLEFLREAHGAEPIVAEVREGARVVAFFTGLVTRRFGIRILGSPLQGWGTGYLGFNRIGEMSSRDAATALVEFAFGPMRCLHLELRDRPLTADDVSGLGFTVQPKKTFELELQRPADEIWSGLKAPCRTAIRKAEKSGVTIEQANGPAFGDEYHAQLCDVFAKQGLGPPYSAELVRRLIAHLEPAGRLLLLRARDADGNAIASGIYPGHGRMAYFWGGASWRRYQSLRPNELLMWSAIQQWRERGVDVFDFAGAGDYKRKYGPTEVSVPLFRRSRVRALEDFRAVAKRTVKLRRRVAGLRLS